MGAGAEANVARTQTWIRSLARTLALVWACFWIFFALTSGAGPGWRGLLSNSPNALPELAFLLSAVIAWRREVAGGILLWLCGIFAFFFFRVYEDLFLLLTLVLPPLVVGILFLVCGRRPRR